MSVSESVPLESIYRKMVENLFDPFYLVGEDSRILFVNPAACAQLGYAEDELVGMRVTALDAQMPVARWEVVWAYLQARGTNHMETVHRAKDGRLVPIEVAATYLEHEGKAYSCCLTRDISARLRLQARMSQTEKMEALGQLAGGVAHDFNNQLVAVLGYAELLADALSDQPELLAHVEQIRTAACRSSELTRQLLDFSRKETERTGPVDVHAVLDEALRMLGRSLPSGVCIERELRAESAVVDGAAGALMNAFLNLALNARDAMPGGGRLQIQTAVLLLDGTFCAAEGLRVAPGAYVQVSVSDEGMGMSPETAARVFEPFFTTKPPGQGTGLGLASVYSTVRAHRGAVTVYSEPGVGSTFRIYLPLAVQPPAPAPLSPLTAVVPGRPWVLVVEDEESVRRVVALLLEAMGCRVVAHASSVEALAWVRAGGARIDVALIDMCMPVLDGAATYRALRALAPALPVVLASGHAMLDAAEQLVDEGAAAFIQKPYQRAVLAETLRRALGREG